MYLLTWVCWGGGLLITAQAARGDDCGEDAAWATVSVRDALDQDDFVDLKVGRAAELEIVLEIYGVAAVGEAAFLNAFLDQTPVSDTDAVLEVVAVNQELPTPPWTYDRSAFDLPCALSDAGEPEYGLIMGDSHECGGFDVPEDTYVEFVLDTLSITASMPGEWEITFEEGARSPQMFGSAHNYLPYTYCSCGMPWCEYLTALYPDIGSCNEPLVILAVACEGDVNLNGMVDPLDSGYVLSRLGCSTDGSHADCDIADANQDSVVDLIDAGYIEARFGICF